MSATIDPTLKSREELDAELDRRIEALRKKNEALMKRHQEIEEDRKKAEEDGISVTNRRPKYEGENDDRKQNGKGIATVTSDPIKPPAERQERQERRAPNDRRSRGGMESPGRRGWAGNVGTPGARPASDTAPHYTSPGNRPDRTPRAEWTERGPREFPDGPEGPEGDRRGRGRRGRRGGGGGGGGGGIDGGIPTGVLPPDRRVKEWEEKRRQNIEQMNEEMEQIAEYERGQMGGSGEKNPMRNFLDDPRRLGSLPDGDRKDGSRRHVRNWGGPDFDKVKTGVDWSKDRQQVRRSDPKDSFDITLSMTGRERAEYMSWKKEREQIDQERLARHRNATGQWKREWDAEKTEPMFKESSRPTEEDSSVRGLKNSKKSYSSSRRTDDQKPPKPPTVSDFIFQSQNKDAKRGRDKRREKNYSMHDDRWETPETEQEEKKEKESKPEPAQGPARAEVKVNADQTPADIPDDADEDQWEDASDSEEEIVGEDVSGSEEEEEEEEEEVVVQTTEETKKDGGGMKEQKVAAEVAITERGPEVGPKGQRMRKVVDAPKLRIPPADVSQDAADTESKPLSPFSLDGYQPVKDWAEEMEVASPRTSVEQNPLQTATTSQDHGQPNVLSLSVDAPTDCGSNASLVCTGQEPAATAEVNGNAGGVPAGEIVEEEVERTTEEAATMEAAEGAEQGSRAEVDLQAGEALELASKTSVGADRVQESEPISG
ncbi:coiled-coil domain-containing protein 9 isoform X4 [Amblyraja radiata]|uniref:coiled-coil domain-containing protein 9 isoform X4 n=1 Tax=Amblyraja radiata TaxID=386614 RepID=UPI0014033E43|nr:coiled-coil domain-containing protein 9 isoform X4 [Amblyraja radiata]